MNKYSYEVHIMKDLEKYIIDDEIVYDIADLFKVFSDSTRVRILVTLFEGELCVGDIADALGMSQTAISHQLRILKHNHLIKYRRDGKNVIYSLADNHVKHIIDSAREHMEE